MALPNDLMNDLIYVRVLCINVVLPDCMITSLFLAIMIIIYNIIMH